MKSGSWLISGYKMSSSIDNSKGEIFRLFEIPHDCGSSVKCQQVFFWLLPLPYIGPAERVNHWFNSRSVDKHVELTVVQQYLCLVKEILYLWFEGFSDVTWICKQVKHLTIACNLRFRNLESNSVLISVRNKPRSPIIKPWRVWWRSAILHKIL